MHRLPVNWYKFRIGYIVPHVPNNYVHTYYILIYYKSHKRKYDHMFYKLICLLFPPFV